MPLRCHQILETPPDPAWCLPSVNLALPAPILSRWGLSCLLSTSSKETKGRRAGAQVGMTPSIPAPAPAWPSGMERGECPAHAHTLCSSPCTLMPVKDTVHQQAADFLKLPTNTAVPKSPMFVWHIRDDFFGLLFDLLDFGSSSILHLGRSFSIVTRASKT